MKETLPTKSNELIIYQLGELKNLVTNLDAKVDKNAEGFEKRLQAVELWKAAEEKIRAEAERVKANPPVNVQQIIMALITLLSIMITGLFTAKQTGFLP